MKRWCAVLGATVVLLGAACGDDDEAASSGPDTTAGAAATTTTIAGAADTPTDESRTEVTTGATSASGSGPSHTEPPTTARGSSPTTTAAASTTATVTKPGRYVYSVTGKQSSPAFGEQPVPPEGTLTVDPPKGRDQRQVEEGGNVTTEQVLRFANDGIYIVYLKITGPGFVLEFRPSPPVLATPRPAPVGRTWSWSMQSTDGTTTVKSDFRVLRTERVTIGSEPVDTVVIQADVVTSGTINSTGRSTFWGSDRYKLVVQDQSVNDGTIGTVAFHSETTSKLRSTQPS